VNHCPDYTAAIFDPARFTETAAWVMQMAQETKIDAIAGMGHSGLPLAAVVAHALSIPLLAVRQRQLFTHDDGRQVNGILPTNQRVIYGIVDDFIASGSSVERVINEIRNIWPNAYAEHIFCWSSEHGRSQGITQRIYGAAPDITLHRAPGKREELPQ
jgi:orotate phosphoribosyltransferase-like protein